MSIFYDLQVMSWEDNMDLVLKGNHMFLAWKYFIRLLVGQKYTDSKGYTPIHLSKTEYFNYGGYSFACR